ncbi:MAG: 5-bromo-4-chloroindolyl phosphate hydrolysis family protein [Clostridia bacterium]|nr:5-bromo-4-chloroindolyl phosphate hydrolysis family protein [Clostridia bacterium]
MANKNNNFDIPIPLIVLAYIFYWPVGVVLTVLRVISENQKKQNAANGRQSAAQMRADFERRMEADAARRQAEQNRIYASERRKTRAEYQTNTAQKPQQTAQSEPIVTNPYYREQIDRKASNKAKNSGAYAGLITGGVIAAVIAGMSLLFAGLAVDTGISLLGVVGIPVLIAAAFFVGAKLYKNREVELNRIKKIIGTKESYNLSKLASASGKSLKKLRKQLQKMIDKGEFGDSAYIDLGSNNFMRNPDATPEDPEGFDYKTVYGDLFAKKKAAEGEETVEEPEDDSDEARFAKILAEIRRLNNQIEDGPVSERIERIEGHTRHIFDYVTEHPEAMPQIRTFMNYYLPTTLKLLESYSRIERVGVAGENMKKSKENIESILDLLVVGFEQQIDQLFRNESIDITADISVLETMMQKDGLSGKNDFDISSFVDGYSDEITDEISDELGGGAAAMGAPEDK